MRVPMAATQPQTFEIVEPPSGDSPVLVEVPHAGLGLFLELAEQKLANLLHLLVGKPPLAGCAGRGSRKGG